MPKLKPVSPNELIRIAEKIGFLFVSQKGSHAKFVNSQGQMLIIPVHAGRKIDGGLLLDIIKKQLKITREEFEKLL